MMLTNAYACVSFFKAWTGKIIFNVAKLRGRNQIDLQLRQNRVNIRGLQMRRCYRCKAALINSEDFSCKKQQVGLKQFVSAS